MFGIEKVIYIYIFVCVSVIVFNIIYVILIKQGKKKDKERALWIRSVLSDELAESQNKKLFKNMENIDFFNVFINIFNEFDEDIRNQYVKEHAKALCQLSKSYRLKDEITQACFAYNIGRMKLCDYMDDDLLELLMSLITSQYPFCRENALQAFYNCHNPEYIIKAMLIIDRKGIYHYDKLIVDGTLTFFGDKEQLGFLLLGIYPEVSIDSKINIINILRGIGDQFSEDIYSLYLVKYEDVDINIAIIRYFARWKYPLFENELLEVLKDKEESWELRAISAFSLRNYPSKETEAMLQENLKDHNWYVRFNSADSLLSIHGDDENLYIDDNYGQEMIEYMRQRNLLQRGE